MSYFGTWICPQCGRTWVGGIGWKWPDNLDEYLEKICGCTGKYLSDQEMGDAIIISIAKVIRESPERESLEKL